MKAKCLYYKTSKLFSNEKDEGLILPIIVVKSFSGIGANKVIDSGCWGPSS